ncbi:MAG: hypothetical protein M3Q71_07435 [Chloroflexota bacterium]|nr:hypothetical protein [Chloroflexota bacterium]MDP9470485.1 hypothetical protein [Chloroflexota bacterium]
MGDFLSTDEAAIEAGMNRRALERRLRHRGLPRYRDPRDGRRILITRADFAEFLTPRPIGELLQRKEVAMTNAT